MLPEVKKDRFYELLGALIRSRRDELKRSLEDVARDSEARSGNFGISKSTLSLMEGGGQQISTWQLYELARMLEFSVDSFLLEVENKLSEEEFGDLKKML